MRNRLIFLSLIIIFGVFCFGLSPVYCQDPYGLSATAGAADLTKYGNSVPTLVGNVIGAGLSMIGVVFFVLMVYGGIMWMTARGNDDQTKKAFNTIVAATIGMIIVLASYALTNFVFSSVGTGGGGGSTPGTCVGPGNTYSCVDNEAKCFEKGDGYAIYSAKTCTDNKQLCCKMPDEE